MSLVKKLLIKPKMQVGVLHAPEGFGEALGQLPEGAAVVASPAPGSLDALVLFVKSMAELQAQAQEAGSLVKYDGLFWVAYPKKTSKIKTDINRDTGWEFLKSLGYAGVGMVAMDETWSIMRYRPAERVGK